MTKTKGGAARMGGLTAGGGQQAPPPQQPLGPVSGGLFSSSTIVPSSSTHLPSPRKPLATKRSQRPSPAYNSPSADYLPHQLGHAASSKKMDTRPSPVWLHTDAAMLETGTEGKRGSEVSELLAEKQRAFAAQFSSGENGGAGTANLPPPGHYDMASSGKLPPTGPTCLTSSDPSMYMSDNAMAGLMAGPPQPPLLCTEPMTALSLDLAAPHTPQHQSYHHHPHHPHHHLAGLGVPPGPSHLGMVSDHLLDGKGGPDGDVLMHHGYHHLPPQHMHVPQPPPLTPPPGLGAPPTMRAPPPPGTTLMGPPAPVDKKKRTAKKAAPKQQQAAGGGGRWTKEEDQKLREAVAKVGPQNWKMIANDWLGEQRSDVQCLHRWQKVLQPGLVKGPWTKEEDQVIVDCIERGITKWSEIAERIPGRIGKQCRERWFNHLDPNLKKGGWTDEEDATLVDAQARWGNAWTKIAKLLPGRSENAVKNRWNSATRRRAKAASRAMAEGRPFRHESKSGLNLNVYLGRDSPLGHGFDEATPDSGDEDDSGDEHLSAGLEVGRMGGMSKGDGKGGKPSELFGSAAPADSLLIVQQAMEYAGMGHTTPSGKEGGGGGSPDEKAASGKKKGGANGSHKKGGKKSAAPHTAGVSALVAAAEAQAAAAGLAAAHAAATANANGSPRSGRGGPQAGAPGFEAPHEEFEHHDTGVQWDFNPEQSGGLGQSIEFLKGVENPVDCAYGSHDLPAMDDGMKGVPGGEEEGMPEEFTLSASLMNISLDKDIVDEMAPDSMGRHANLQELEGKSGEFIAHYLAQQQQAIGASPRSGSSSSFRARKPADLLIDCRNASGQQGGQGSAKSGGRGFSPYSAGGGGSRPSSTRSKQDQQQQQLFGSHQLGSPSTSALAGLAGGQGLMMMMMMSGGQLTPTQAHAATSAAAAAAALGAATAAAGGLGSGSCQHQPGGLMGRLEDFFLQSPPTTPGGRMLAMASPSATAAFDRASNSSPTAMSARQQQPASPTAVDFDATGLH